MDLSSKGTVMNTPLIRSNNKHSIDTVKHGPLYRTPSFQGNQWRLEFRMPKQCGATDEKSDTVNFIQSEYKHSSDTFGTWQIKVNTKTDTYIWLG